MHRSLDLKRPNLPWQHSWERDVFLWVRHAPNLRGGAQRPVNFCTPTDAHTVWPRATRFGTVVHVKEQCGSMGQLRPLKLEGGPGAYPNFWDLLHARAQHDNFARWSNWMLAKFLQGQPRPLPWPTVLVTQMLTRDLFAVANLPVFNYNWTDHLDPLCHVTFQCGRTV